MASAVTAMLSVGLVTPVSVKPKVWVPVTLVLVLRRVMRGSPSTGVVTLLVQLPVALHNGSPPPVAVAVLATLGEAPGKGVTGMTKAAVPVVAASPAGTVQLTTCPLALQPAGMVPSVSVAGTVSLIVAGAEVGTGPMLFSVSV